MAIGVTFPIITGGVDLSIGTGMVCYALIGGSMIRNHNVPVVVAMLICVVLGLIIGAVNGVLIGVMNLPPFLATLCTCMITRGLGSLYSATPWPGLTQEGGWFHSIFKLTVGTGRSADRYPIGFVDDPVSSFNGICSESYKIRTLHYCNRFQQRSSSSFRNQC